MFRLFKICFLAIGLAVLPSKASANSVDELAREAVMVLCSQLMEIETPLSEEESIKERGYKAKATRNHPRYGVLDIVSRTVDDGEVWIANSREASFCQVGMTGKGALGAFNDLRDGYRLLDQALVPIKSDALINEKLDLLTLQTPTVDGTYYGVQFINLSAMDADSPLVIQQYLLKDT